MRKKRGGQEGSVAASTDPRLPTFQIYFSAIALFYLFVAILIIIVAWIAPGNPLGGQIAFTLVGVIVLVAAIVHVAYRNELIAYACGSCPPHKFT